MSEHIFSTPDGTVFVLYDRENQQNNTLETKWAIRIFSKETNTYLGFGVMYPLAFFRQDTDNQDRDFALVDYVLKNDTDRVREESKKGPGYEINCAQEPYRTICGSF